MAITEEIFKKIRRGDRIHYKSEFWDFTATVADIRFGTQLSFKNYWPKEYIGRFTTEDYFSQWSNMTPVAEEVIDTSEEFQAQNGKKIKCSIKKL